MRKIRLLGAALLVFGPMAANATIVTFNEFGNPGTLTGNEWASFGINVSGVYWYTDSRDPFDQVGIANQAQTGVITFLNVISSLTVDWLTINSQSINIDLYDSSGALIDNFFQAGSGNLSGTVSFSGAIASMQFYNGGGQVGISTLDFEVASVPEPGTLALLGIGLAGMAIRRRKTV